MACACKRVHILHLDMPFCEVVCPNINHAGLTQRHYGRGLFDVIASSDIVEFRQPVRLLKYLLQRRTAASLVFACCGHVEVPPVDIHGQRQRLSNRAAEDHSAGYDRACRTHGSSLVVRTILGNASKNSFQSKQCIPGSATKIFDTLKRRGEYRT